MQLVAAVAIAARGPLERGRTSSGVSYSCCCCLIGRRVAWATTSRARVNLHYTSSESKLPAGCCCCCINEIQHRKQPRIASVAPRATKERSRERERGKKYSVRGSCELCDLKLSELNKYTNSLLGEQPRHHHHQHHPCCSLLPQPLPVPKGISEIISPRFQFHVELAVAVVAREKQSVGS